MASSQGKETWKTKVGKSKEKTDRKRTRSGGRMVKKKRQFLIGKKNY